MGQKGTLGPSSWLIAKAIAVLPVPGAPANKIALPAIFFYFIMSTATKAAFKNDIFIKRIIFLFENIYPLV